jgi:hypothetical protein
LRLPALRPPAGMLSERGSCGLQSVLCGCYGLFSDRLQDGYSGSPVRSLLVSHNHREFLHLAAIVERHAALCLLVDAELMDQPMQAASRDSQ